MGGGMLACVRGAAWYHPRTRPGAPYAVPAGSTSKCPEAVPGAPTEDSVERTSLESRDPKGGPAGAGFWITTALLSGAGSMAAVRFATPLTVDEKSTAALMFFVLPAVLIFLLSAIHRHVGTALAVLLPFVWLAAARDASDGLFLWLVPILTSGLILLAGWRAGGRTVKVVPPAASLVVGLAVLMWPAPVRPADGTRVLLIGIDGATWAVIDPLVREGKMPNLEGCLDGGHRARLRTLPSMFSPQVWSTLATGCPPSIHGIEGFDNLQQDFRVGRIWDQLRAEGRSFGLSGWYFTWPPPSDLGERDFVIPSTLAPDSRAFPPEYGFYWRIWAREVSWRQESVSYLDMGLNAFRLGVRLSTLRGAVVDVAGRRFGNRTPLDQAWRSRRLSAALQGDIFAGLVRSRRPEFAAILFNQVDKTSHLYWKFLRPDSFPEVTEAQAERYGLAIHQLYMEIDRNLGKILRSAPTDVSVVIVSDHGFQAMASRTAGQYCRIRTENVIAALGATADVFGTNLDQRVYLRATSTLEEERERVLAEVGGALRETRVSGETKPLFEVTRDGGTLVVGIAPRDAVPMEAAIILQGEKHPFRSLIRASAVARFSGVHDVDGIFVLSGPLASNAVLSDSLNVVDVAPTVAGLLGLPVSPVWTGRPALTGLSVSDLGVTEYPLPGQSGTPPPEKNQELREKLKAIGYLE